MKEHRRRGAGQYFSPPSTEKIIKSGRNHAARQSKHCFYWGVVKWSELEE